MLGALCRGGFWQPSRAEKCHDQAGIASSCDPAEPDIKPHRGPLFLGFLEGVGLTCRINLAPLPPCSPRLFFPVVLCLSWLSVLSAPLLLRLFPEAAGPMEHGQRTMELVLGLEYKFCEELLRELNCLIWRKGRRPYILCNQLRGNCGDWGVSPFSLVTSNRTRENGFKLHQRG